MEFQINYHDNHDIIFLDIVKYGAIKHCVGSATLSDGKWIVTINAIYDPETDSDSQLIGYYDDQPEAQLALWQARQQAAACSGVYV